MQARLRTILYSSGRRVTAGLIVAAICGGIATAQDGPPSMPPTPVRAAQVKLEDVQEHRQVTGDLRAVTRSKVATIEPGRVVECPIQEGDAVKKGDVLVKLDGRRLRLEIQRITAQGAVATAMIAERAAQVDLERRDLEAIRDLLERGASNPKELADAESELDVAIARKDQAEQDAAVLSAQADLLRTRLEDTTITAPFDGVIVAKHTEIGQWAGLGDSLAELVSIGAFDAYLDVPQRFAAAVAQQGVTIPVEVGALKERFDPVTPRIIRQVDDVARTFSLVVRIEDEAGLLTPGMSVIGWLPTGERGDHIIVPRDAVMRNEVGFFVYVVSQASQGPAQAAPRPISIAFEHNDSIAVHPGTLRSGDLVVTEGNERLFPMMPIAVINDDRDTATQESAGAGKAASEAVALPGTGGE